MLHLANRPKHRLLIFWILFGVLVVTFQQVLGGLGFDFTC